jgi:hypothetical protein
VKRKPSEKAAWHRRSGVIWRPGTPWIPREPRYGFPWSGVWNNDGGDDAPLSSRDRSIYHWIIGAVVVIGVALMLVWR